VKTWAVTVTGGKCDKRLGDARGRRPERGSDIGVARRVRAPLAVAIVPVALVAEVALTLTSGVVFRRTVTRGHFAPDTLVVRPLPLTIAFLFVHLECLLAPNFMQFEVPQLM
jgi:hypothetical protein